MFPVISLLRRTASAYVYVTSEHLQKQDGRYWLRLEKAASSVDVSTGRWNPATELAPVYMLTARGSSSADAAIALTKAENALHEQIKAQDLIYTLIMGPEDEADVDDGVERRARYAIVRGVLLANAPTLVPAVPKKTQSFKFGAVPQRKARNGR
jgi:hypothetical protein